MRKTTTVEEMEKMEEDDARSKSLIQKRRTLTTERSV